MSESERPAALLHGVVVAHGSMAAAMIEAAELVSGVKGALRAVSNTDCDRGGLETRIVEAVGERPAVVFIDMMGGSCMMAAMRRLRERADVRVVTGVNLAMLLEFLFHREGAVDAAADRAVAAGGEAIRST